jgi:hypothetical protein
MIAAVEEFETRLKRLDPDDNAFVLQGDELIGALAPSIADKVYLAILQFFERHPNADCGAPGTLVHHMEEFYPNYVDALIESVNRRPSYNGALMVNRILNTDIDPKLRSRLLAVLNGIIQGDKQVATHVLEMVRGFVERQSGGSRTKRST